MANEEAHAEHHARLVQGNGPPADWLTRTRGLQFTGLSRIGPPPMAAGTPMVPGAHPSSSAASVGLPTPERRASQAPRNVVRAQVLQGAPPRPTLPPWPARAATPVPHAPTRTRTTTADPARDHSAPLRAREISEPPPVHRVVEASRPVPYRQPRTNPAQVMSFSEACTSLADLPSAAPGQPERGPWPSLAPERTLPARDGMGEPRDEAAESLDAPAAFATFEPTWGQPGRLDPTSTTGHPEATRPVHAPGMPEYASPAWASGSALETDSPRWPELPQDDAWESGRLAEARVDREARRARLERTARGH